MSWMITSNSQLRIYSIIMGDTFIKPLLKMASFTMLCTMRIRSCEWICVRISKEPIIENGVIKYILMQIQ